MLKIQKKLQNRIKLISEIEVIAFEILQDESLGEQIIETIQDRIYDDGIDANGEILRTDEAIESNNPAYSFNTYFIKGNKGQKTSNVTLKDTGDFYKSWEIIESFDGIDLEADFKNIYDNFMMSYEDANDFENAILNLNKEEKKELIFTVIKQQILNKIK